MKHARLLGRALIIIGLVAGIITIAAIYLAVAPWKLAFRIAYPKLNRNRNRRTELEAIAALATALAALWRQHRAPKGPSEQETRAAVPTLRC